MNQPRRRAATRHCLAEKLPFPFRRKELGAREIKKSKGNFSARLRAQPRGAAGLCILQSGKKKKGCGENEFLPDCWGFALKMLARG
jgi:hypothetical protein